MIETSDSSTLAPETTSTADDVNSTTKVISTTRSSNGESTSKPTDISNTYASSKNYTSVTTSTDVQVPGTSTEAISVPVFVGTLVGVIALLILLSTAVITVLSYAYLKKYKTKENQDHGEDNGYDYVIEGGNEARNPIEMMTNEAYKTRRQADSQENTTDHEPQAIETHYEEVH